jgi:hypothetical protein
VLPPGERLSDGAICGKSRKIEGDLFTVNKLGRIVYS